MRGPSPVRRATLAACACLLALGGCGGGVFGHRYPASAAAAAVTVAQAEQVVRSYFTDMAAGRDSAAAHLWSTTWQRAHPISGWASSPPLPPGVQPEFGGATANGGGTVTLAVRGVAGSPLGPRWATGTFTVGMAAGSPRLLGGGLQPPSVPLNLQSLAVRGAAGDQTGDAPCGGYTVRWSLRADATAGRGAVSAVAVTAPDGHRLPLPALPGFSFGTVPTFCGDLLGNGGMDLVLTTATTSAHYYRQAVVYALSPTAVRLIGQVPSAQDARYPRPVAEDGLVPYAMVGMHQIDDVGYGPILAPVIWAFSGGIYQRETPAFPDVLRRDIVRRLADPGAWRRCARGFVACASPDLLVAYYDYAKLGEASAGLAHLETLVPSGERAWLVGQAQVVAMNIALP